MGAYGFYELEYVRTDRNGTKIYHDNNCPHCSGYGSLEKWARTGKTCFECGGSGLRPRPKIVKIYTPEHRAKLDAQKAARDAKRLVENPPPSEEKLLDAARESVLSIWENQGFNRDGSGFILSGNTYPNRDAIYKDGGRWCRFLKAYIAPRPIDGLRGIKIAPTSAEALCNAAGYVDIDKALKLSETL